MLISLAEEKKARNPRLLDVRKCTSYTSYVLLVSGTSDRHLRSLADYLQEGAKAKGVRSLGVEGYEASVWILLDFGEVVVHLFQEETRDYYDLDHLWTEASSLPIEGNP